jgi:ATP-dependent RNA helicase DHX37/DHR1
MPPPVRERYNAKARGKGDSGRSHKIGKKKKPVEVNEDDVKAAQPHHEAGMSSKKRKRLDSYIVRLPPVTTLTTIR